MMIRRGVVVVLAGILSGCSSQPMRDLQQALGLNRGETAFATAMRQYENGQYTESGRNLQAAIDLGLAAGQRASAHKHLAFMHCASNRERLCRDEFGKALAIEPKLELTAAEAGHPVWGPVFRSVKGGSPLLAGLRQYDEGKYDEAATTLQGAIARGLSAKDRAIAHKHLAFIHCASNRERLCRDEFRRALDFDPGLQLSAAEAGHPSWGPVFRSMRGEPAKGEVATVKVASASAAKGEPLLAAGLRYYDDGNYDASLRTLSEALTLGLPSAERVKAHKHLAFVHCASDRQRLCREEFGKALAIDPALELNPAEAGHPVWGPVFRAVKASR